MDAEAVHFEEHLKHEQTQEDELCIGCKHRQSKTNRYNTIIKNDDSDNDYAVAAAAEDNEDDVGEDKEYDYNNDNSDYDNDYAVAAGQLLSCIVVHALQKLKKVSSFKHRCTSTLSLYNTNSSLTSSLCCFQRQHLMGLLFNNSLKSTASSK